MSRRPRESALRLFKFQFLPPLELLAWECLGVCEWLCACMCRSKRDQQDRFAGADLHHVRSEEVDVCALQPPITCNPWMSSGRHGCRRTARGLRVSPCRWHVHTAMHVFHTWTLTPLDFSLNVDVFHELPGGELARTRMQGRLHEGQLVREKLMWNGQSPTLQKIGGPLAPKSIRYASRGLGFAIWPWNGWVNARQHVLVACWPTGLCDPVRLVSPYCDAKPVHVMRNSHARIQ